MTDQKDPALRLFGRVIPLAPDAAAPAAIPPETAVPPVASPEAGKDQLKEIEDNKDNEKKVDVPQEKEDNVMKVDVPQEKEDNEMKVDAPQEKEDNGMKVDAPQEKEDNRMKVDTSQEKEDNGMKIDVLQEKGGDELRADAHAPQVMEKVELVSSSTSDHTKEDQGQMNNAEGKAASDSNKENEKTEEDESGQDKVLKKPDKIIPCPRCNSMDTKFCYYNNYNINQPRHFCKNCQRYWTAGGTMRNVPVGAGRRKSKNASLHYRHLLMPPDCMMGSRVDISKSVNPEGLVSSPSIPIHLNSRNETVLKFGPEVPLCESMASVLNIEEQNVTNAGSAPKGENGENNSCASSITSHNGLPENAPGAPVYCNGVGPVPQYYLGAPFMYPWSIGWNNLPIMVPGKSVSESSPSESCSTSSTPWMNSPMMPLPSGLSAPAFPYPMVPPALWGCLSSWPATPWSMPWIGTNSCISPSSSSNSSCSGNGSPTLGKHSRDSNPLKEDKEEKSLWVPKTLRIDDPDEAAKSSIWATLGIKPGEPGSFKPFQSKNESKGQASDVRPARVLHANPAAFSRSQTFQEGS